MNGRCETDPLDRAVDVCDRCYGEFCETHLVRPKGRKHPFCSECALTASGVRGSAKVELRGDRRTAKQRRKDLHEAVAVDEQVFEFFEYEPADHGPGDDADTAGSRDLEPVATDQAADDSDRADVESTQTSTDSEDSGDVERTTRDEEEPSRSVDPRPLEDTPPTPAVAQLEKLRREAEARANSQDPDRPNPHGAAPPRSDPKPEVPARPTPPPEKVTLPSRQSTRPPALKPEPVGSTERAPVAEEPQRTRLATSGERAVDRRRPPAPTHRRPTAPMIGEVRNVAGRRADDNPVQDATDRRQPPPAGDDPDDARNAVEGFDADRQGSDETDGESRSADLDARGAWIPPILRGMAPDAAEAKANLPQRPRR